MTIPFIQKKECHTQIIKLAAAARKIRNLRRKVKQAGLDGDLYMGSDNAGVAEPKTSAPPRPPLKTYKEWNRDLSIAPTNNPHISRAPHHMDSTTYNHMLQTQNPYKGFQPTSGVYAASMPFYTGPGGARTGRGSDNFALPINHSLAMVILTNDDYNQLNPRPVAWDARTNPNNPPENWEYRVFGTKENPFYVKTLSNTYSGTPTTARTNSTEHDLAIGALLHNADGPINKLTALKYPHNMPGAAYINNLAYIPLTHERRVVDHTGTATWKLPEDMNRAQLVHAAGREMDRLRNEIPGYDLRKNNCHSATAYAIANNKMLQPVVISTGGPGGYVAYPGAPGSPAFIAPFDVRLAAPEDIKRGEELAPEQQAARNQLIAKQKAEAKRQAEAERKKAIPRPANQSQRNLYNSSSATIPMDTLLRGASFNGPV